jgi:hypothetical protein
MSDSEENEIVHGAPEVTVSIEKPKKIIMVAI